MTQLFNFEVLGSNTVAELRAIFSCENGITCWNELNHPDELKDPNYAEKEIIAEVLTRIHISISRNIHCFAWFDFFLNSSMQCRNRSCAWKM